MTKDKLTLIIVKFLTLLKCKAVGMILNSRVVRPCFRFYSTTSDHYHILRSQFTCVLYISHCLLSRLHSSHTTSMSEHINVCVCLSVGVCEGYQPEGKAAWWCDAQIRKKE